MASSSSFFLFRLDNESADFRLPFLETSSGAGFSILSVAGAESIGVSTVLALSETRLVSEMVEWTEILGFSAFCMVMKFIEGTMKPLDFFFAIKSDGSDFH